jgi:hypothetical protein
MKKGIKMNLADFLLILAVAVFLIWLNLGNV